MIWHQMEYTWTLGPWSTSLCWPDLFSLWILSSTTEHLLYFDGLEESKVCDVSDCRDSPRTRWCCIPRTSSSRRPWTASSWTWPPPSSSRSWGWPGRPAGTTPSRPCTRGCRLCCRQSPILSCNQIFYHILLEFEGISVVYLNVYNKILLALIADYCNFIYIWK